MATNVQEQITATALQYGVDPNIALAVAQRESGYNQGARGAAGEVGVFQLMPGTAAGLGVDPYSLTDNIRGGVMYLRQMYEQFGNWTEALAAYNAGPGNVSQGIIPGSTQRYVDAILGAVGNAVKGIVPSFSVTGWGQPVQQEGLIDTSQTWDVGVNWWLLGGAVVGLWALWRLLRD